MRGDFLDVDSLRQALSGVSTLFLLNAVVADEFTQALIVLNLAREAGIQRVVYLSVIHSDFYVNVPHFAGKFGVERMIEGMGFSATILRPAYFMNNDVAIKDVVTGHGVYPMPIGGKGLAWSTPATSARSRPSSCFGRESSPRRSRWSASTSSARTRSPGRISPRSGPKRRGRPVAYGGEDTAAFEQKLPPVHAGLDGLRHALMAERFLTDGMLPETGDRDRLTALLGRPLRSYRRFALETLAAA